MTYSKLTIIACDRNSFIEGEAMHLEGIVEKVSFPRGVELTLVLDESLYSKLQAKGPISLQQVETDPSSNSRCYSVNWKSLRSTEPYTARLKILRQDSTGAKPFTVVFVEGPVALPVPGKYGLLEGLDSKQQFIIDGQRYQKGSKLILTREPDVQCWPIRGSKLGAEDWMSVSSRVKSVSSISVRR